MATSEVLDLHHSNAATVDSPESVTRTQGAGYHPSLCCGIPERVVLRRVNDAFLTLCSDREIGTIRINGKCLDISFIGTQNKSVVALYTCLGGAVAQQWVTGPGNSVRNPNSGRCLDDPYATSINSTQLWIWDCNGGDAQNWRLPD